MHDHIFTLYETATTTMPSLMIAGHKRQKQKKMEMGLDGICEKKNG